jgi:hypothetical protein
MWDIQIGQELAMAALDGALECIAVAPDSVTVVAGDRGGNVYYLRYMDSSAGTIAAKKESFVRKAFKSILPPRRRGGM